MGKDHVKLHEYLNKNQPDWIRKAALVSKHLNASHIDRALGDDYWHIRWYATQHPIYKQHYPNGHEIVN